MGPRGIPCAKKGLVGSGAIPISEVIGASSGHSLANHPIGRALRLFSNDHQRLHAGSAENLIRHQSLYPDDSTVLCQEIHLFKDMFQQLSILIQTRSHPSPREDGCVDGGP